MTTPAVWRFVRSSALLELVGTILVFCIALVQPQNASADGMMFQPSNVTSEIRAEAQRAVLWLRDGEWQLSIYPRFVREEGSSAWVVPFPVRPTITEGSTELFDELETITAPVIVEFCYDPYCCCDDYYCMDMSAAGGEGSADSVDASVDVWETGVVGSFDYVVISSTDGESITTWLDDNGFDIPDDASPLIGALANEGSFFFAAKLSADADNESPITPVTFELADLEDPMYPLRLTAAGVGDGETLGLVLWLVTPKEQIYDVANNVGQRVDYHGVLAYHPFVQYPIDCVDIESYDYYYFFGYCVDFSMFGYELSQPFSAPLQEIIDGHYVVTRWAADLDAAAMASDMLFEPNEDPNLEINYEEYDGISNIGFTEGGQCYSCPACPDPPVEPQPDHAEESYPDYAEPTPDAGFPDVIANDDSGSRQDTATNESTDSTHRDNTVGCSTLGRPHPFDVIGLVVMLLCSLALIGRRPVRSTRRPA